MTFAALGACSLFRGSQTALPTRDTIGLVRQYTDSDVVTGVAVGPDATYVATLRGLIRHPTAPGVPVRLMTEHGLPDNQVFAVSAGSDGSAWVGTARGVARWDGERWMRVGTMQPEIGRITAILALEGRSALVGGAQGLARYDGTRWVRLTNQYQVTALVLDQGRVLVATANAGILALRGDFDSLDEYGLTAGIPETLVRSMVPGGGNRFWALLQSEHGAMLGLFDGHRWHAYTHERVRDPWIGLVAHQGRVALVAQGGMYDILEGRGDRLVPVDVGNSVDGQRRVTLTLEPVSEPMSSAPPSDPGRGRGPGRPRGRAAGRGRHAPVDFAAQRASQSTLPLAASSAPAPRAVQPRNIPGFTGPVERPHEPPTQSSPALGLERVTDVSLDSDLAGVWSLRTGVYVWRIGLAVSRVVGGAADYRAHDLAMSHRALSLATDANGKVWLVTDDGGAVRYDGRRFARVQLDRDASVVPLMFWSRGTVAAAVGRVGPNVIRTYRFGGNAWQTVTERPIDTGGAGVIDAKFLAVDERGRYWVGIRVVNNGTAREHGVAVLDNDLPAATQFNTHVALAGGVQGAVPSPDDLTAADFDSEGTAWFAGLTGATSIRLSSGPGQPAVVRTYNETTGLRGDLVSDLTRGPGNRVYLATTEGVGYHDGTQFAFDLPGSSTMPRVNALAIDVNGRLWGAGQRGAWVFDGTRFRTIGGADHIPEGGLNDVQVDGENRVWFVTADGITILEPSQATQHTAVDADDDSRAGTGATN